MAEEVTHPVFELCRLRTLEKALYDFSCRKRLKS